VQSAGGEVPRFPTWFDALDWMCGEISRTDFDVAIIGAGAYGLPLAAHCKRIGRKAIHLGGASQLMFGIRGRRWDAWEYYQRLANEHWTRALPEETPRNAQIIEGATYW
jgi:glycine/D-amino acid oxidase-like deaminating enzyme